MDQEHTQSTDSNGEAPATRYTLTPRITPLPSTCPADCAQDGATEETRREADPASAPSFGAGTVRAENEDDDGYDPYSDRQPHQKLFEEDPWR